MARLERLLRAHEQAVAGQRAKLDPAGLMVTMKPLRRTQWKAQECSLFVSQR